MYSETLYIKTTLGTNKMWSLYTGGLYAGSIAWKVECSLYKQMVIIYRWALELV